MPKVQLYTKQRCPYCVRAKALLTAKGVTFEEIDVENDDAKRIWLMEASGQRTMPQIFVDGHPLGGFDDIDALDQEGKLDPILSGKVSPVAR